MRYITIVLFLFFSISLLATTPFVGELSLSTNVSGTTGADMQVTTRYLPAFEIQSELSETWDYDLEVRWQLSWSSSLDTPDFSESATLFEPYRVALNLQSSHSEFIIGLQ